MTLRFAILCAAGALYLLGTPARAATSIAPNMPTSWLAAATIIALLCALVLTTVVTRWRRRMKAAAEAITAARERSLKRHTQRTASEMAEPNF